MIRISAFAVPAIAALLAAFALPRHGAAQAPSPATGFPGKPVRFVIPNPPGGVTDMLARLLAQRLQAKWGQPVVPDNRPGANQIIASELAARAAPDGYTILFGTHQSHQNNAGLYAKLPYDPVRDFAPISLLVTSPLLLLVHPSLPVKSMGELLALARAKPGSLNYGTTGNGSGGHIATSWLENMASVRMTHVPYKGPAAATVDQLAGRIDVRLDVVSSQLANIRSAKTRPLAVTSRERLAVLPDVPTVAESAGLPGFEVIGWFGMFAPAGTPREIVMKYNAEAVSVLSEPALRKQLTDQGLVVVASTPEEFGQHVAREVARWGKFIRDAHIVAQ